MSIPLYPGPGPNGIHNISLLGDIQECNHVNLTWQGGLPPVRVEFYQQRDNASGWEVVPKGMYNIDYNGTNGLLEWQVNVLANHLFWVSVTDHAGEYRQIQQPWNVAHGNVDCITIDRPFIESGLTNMAKIFLTFLLVAVCIIFGLGFLLHKQHKQLMRKAVVRAVSEDDTRSLRSLRSIPEDRYSPYQLSSTINGTSRTNPFSDSSGSPQTWTSTDPSSIEPLMAQAQPISHSYPQLQPITRSYSRSSAAPSYQSSQNETIYTVATVQTSSASNGPTDTDSEPRSSVHESDSNSNAQFFPLRVPAGTASWKGSRNPFASRV